LAAVFAAKVMRKALEQSSASKEKLREEKRRFLRERLREGLAGQKFGKHTVQKPNIDVQLGEDLTDSLRGLKVSFRGIIGLVYPGGFNPIRSHTAGR
jgi:nucleolar protein 53